LILDFAKEEVWKEGKANPQRKQGQAPAHGGKTFSLEILTIGAKTGH
jgi:hypothetical protein